MRQTRSSDLCCRAASAVARTVEGRRFAHTNSVGSSWSRSVIVDAVINARDPVRFSATDRQSEIESRWTNHRSAREIIRFTSWLAPGASTMASSVAMPAPTRFTRAPRRAHPGSRPAERGARSRAPRGRGAQDARRRLGARQDLRRAVSRRGGARGGRGRLAASTPRSHGARPMPVNAGVLGKTAQGGGPRRESAVSGVRSLPPHGGVYNARRGAQVVRRVLATPSPCAMFKDNADAFSVKGILTDIMEPIMGDGLIPGNQVGAWAKRRPTVGAGFHGAWLKHMVTLFTSPRRGSSGGQARTRWSPTRTTRDRQPRGRSATPWRWTSSARRCSTTSSASDQGR